MLETLFEGGDRLRNLHKVGDRLTPTFKKFGAYRKRRLVDHINAGRDPYGKTYAPLNPLYAKRKRQKYGSKPILVASGKAIRSHRFYYNNSSGIYSEVIDPRYAYSHQWGTKHHPKRLYLPEPERGLPDEDEAVLVKLIKQRINQDISKL